MAATASIKVTKQSSRKGVATHRWSNRYHLNAQPPDDASWHALMDAVVTAEKAIFTGDVTIVQVDGYAPGSDVPVSTKTYTTVGTSTATGTPTPSDAAALVRYATTQRTTKNHPVYLFNYYHFPLMATGSVDTLNATQKAAMQAYANQWVSPGFSDGTTSYLRAGPNGAVAQSATVAQYITHRDFPD